MMENIVLTTKYQSLVTISCVMNFNRIDTGLMSFELEIKREKNKHMQFFIYIIWEKA